jgi:hypothetical protein
MIIICNNDKNNELLEKYILDFISFNDKSNSKLFGIDFEFNRDKGITKGSSMRKIALCQINFIKNNKSDIFLFYPPNIKKDIFKNLLLCDCYKIFHGGESLDLPYLFDNIIDKKDRNKFCNKLVDTRYLCEYYNSLQNNSNSNSKNDNIKCKIYDLLLGMKVINKNKYDELMKNDHLMGNIWEIDIDIMKDSFIKNKQLIKYCIYDVVYLPQLFNKFKNILPNNIINIIIDLGCKIFIMRHDKQLDLLYTSISKYNLTKYNDYNYNEYYIAVFEWTMTDDIIYNLYQINYFKKYIELNIKCLLYKTIDSSILINNFILNDLIINYINNLLL